VLGLLLRYHSAMVANSFDLALQLHHGEANELCQTCYGRLICSELGQMLHVMVSHVVNLARLLKVLDSQIDHIGLKRALIRLFEVDHEQKLE